MNSRSEALTPEQIGVMNVDMNSAVRQAVEAVAAAKNDSALNDEQFASLEKTVAGVVEPTVRESLYEVVFRAVQEALGEKPEPQKPIIN